MTRTTSEPANFVFTSCVASSLLSNSADRSRLRLLGLKD